MKELAASQSEKRARAIVVEAQVNMSAGAVALMPSYNALRQRIQNKRVEKYA
jgi:hypothetical protein